MAELIGQVVSVDTRNVAENTVSDAPVGATVLYLTDASPFVGTSGACVIDGTAYSFDSVDADADKLTLSTPLSVAIPADSSVEVFPPTPEKYATVDLDAGGEAVPILVPHALVELLPDGIRDPLDQETVTIETSGYAPMVTNVIGKPLAQGVIEQWRLTSDLLALIRMRFADETERATLVPTPDEGSTSYLVSTGLEYVYYAGQWAPLSVYVKKAVSQSVTSSTTLVNDDALWVDLVPGTYRVEVMLHATGSSGSTGDIKVAWSYSGGPIVTGNRLARGMAVDDTDGTAARTRTTGHFIDTSVAYGLEAAADGLTEDILLRVNTAGRMQLRWAQNTSSSTPTTVSGASRIYVTRLADRT